MKKVTVYAAEKDDPIKENAIDGMRELLDGDEGFEYPPLDPDKTLEEYFEEIKNL